VELQRRHPLAGDTGAAIAKANDALLAKLDAVKP
jgi:hypothetical protein